VVDEWHATTASGAVLRAQDFGSKVAISAIRRSISATGINALTSLFKQSDHNKEKERSGIEMKKFGFATIVASGLAAAFFGFAAPAQASTVVSAPTIAAAHSSGVDHLDWLNDIQPKVNVPKVDTSPRSNP
jgi:hypothetical protein